MKGAGYFLVGTALLLFLIMYGFLRIPAALSGGLISPAGGGGYGVAVRPVRLAG